MMLYYDFLNHIFHKTNALWIDSKIFWTSLLMSFYSFVNFDKILLVPLLLPNFS